VAVSVSPAEQTVAAQWLPAGLGGRAARTAAVVDFAGAQKLSKRSKRKWYFTPTTVHGDFTALATLPRVTPGVKTVFDRGGAENTQCGKQWL
jgi:hypothetical protein